MPDVLNEAQRAYARRFGGAPTIAGLPEALALRAAHVMLRRVEIGHGFRDDTDFYDALGRDPPWPQ